MQVESVPGGRQHSLHFAEVEDAQKVSVMSLGGEVLVVLVVSGSSSVWELKGLLEMHILGRSVKAIWMTLLLGHQALANATSLREAGVVDGSMLSLIVSPRYNLLVCKNSPTIELRHEEGILVRTLLIPTGGDRVRSFLPGQCPGHHRRKLPGETVATGQTGVSFHLLGWRSNALGCFQSDWRHRTDDLN